MIDSPLFSGAKCELEMQISTDTLSTAYKHQFSIDVSEIFQNIPTINLYKCSKTGYRFYTPFTLSGNGKFYEQLQHFDWYYMPWKWEHQIAYDIVKSVKNPKVLEVGCGSGSFVEYLKNRDVKVTGLELNNEAVNTAKEKGLNVLGESVTLHSDENPGIYDIVCSFQVLEHVAEVHSFLTSKISCLKRGGKLIICVPNNRSFIKDDKNNILNAPPHHMGLWDEFSLRSLEDIYSIKVERILFEPLQNYHFEWYARLLEQRISKYKFVNKIYFRLNLSSFILNAIKYISPLIKGHSVLAVYKKV